MKLEIRRGRAPKGSTAKRKMPHIGFHAPIKGGLQNALLRAEELNCQTVQIFSRNPRGWQARSLSDEEIELFRSVRSRTKIAPVLVHANYLINLATSDKEMLEKSRTSFQEELTRAVQLGADYLVVHPGSARGSCEADALMRCAESIRIASDIVDLGGVRILLENTAGQGDCIGHRFSHLNEIMAACHKIPLGVCLDTAHVFTAGYDIREEEGLDSMIGALDREVGTANVRAIHFNDSKAAFHSRVDRHWHIGEGHIGRDGLGRVARHPSFAQAAFILETLLDDPGDDLRNVSALRSLIEDGPEN